MESEKREKQATKNNLTHSNQSKEKERKFSYLKNSLVLSLEDKNKPFLMNPLRKR